MSEGKQSLEHVDAVTVLAICFLLAPLGNMMLTFYMMGVPSWYEPWVLWSLSKRISILDHSLNGASVITGLLLMFRRKIAWLAAIGTLLISFCINAFLIFEHWGAQNHLFGQALGCLVSSISVAFLILRFRYPYLDRRDQWTDVHTRYEVNLEVSMVNPSKARLLLINLSKSGALLKFLDFPDFNLKSGSVVTLNILESNIECSIVRISGEVFALKFIDLSRDSKRSIAKLIQKGRKL